jgi:hypothetical protein
MFVTAAKAVKEVVKRQAADSPEPLTPEEIDALAQKELERQEFAKEMEERRKRMRGQATGDVVGREVDLAFTGRRDIGTYTNPLKGKYAGLRMNELPGGYIRWACECPGIKGWVRGLFVKEQSRRNGIAKTGRAG